jgi:hypothetical protein
MFRSLDHLQSGNIYLKLVVCILLRVLGQVQGFRLTQLCFYSCFLFIQIIRCMFRFYDHLQVGNVYLKLVVCILLCVLDQVQGFRLTQLCFYSCLLFIQIIRYMFRSCDHLQVGDIYLKLVVCILLRVLGQVQGFCRTQLCF